MGDENEMGIRFPGWERPASVSEHTFLYHNATPEQGIA